MNQSQTLKRVKLTFDSQFVGTEETEVFIPVDATDEYIRELFHGALGLRYDDKQCRYQTVEVVRVGEWLQPDLEIDISDMIAYGYKWAGMCPLNGDCHNCAEPGKHIISDRTEREKG